MASSANDDDKTGAACGKVEILHVSPYTKITRMDQGPQHRNLLEEKVGNGLGLIGPAKDFLNRTLIPQTLNPTIKGGTL